MTSSAKEGNQNPCLKEFVPSTLKIRYLEPCLVKPDVCFAFVLLVHVLADGQGQLPDGRKLPVAVNLKQRNLRRWPEQATILLFSSRTLSLVE